jgi:hypothetical protein
VTVTGTRRYCPDCGRLLALVAYDGGIAINGRSRVIFVEQDDGLMLVDASCERWRCRVSRWRREGVGQ